MPELLPEGRTALATPGYLATGALDNAPSHYHALFRSALLLYGLGATDAEVLTQLHDSPYAWRFARGVCQDPDGALDWLWGLAVQAKRIHTGEYRDENG